MTLKETLCLLTTDIDRRLLLEGKSLHWWNKVLILYKPGVVAVLIYRFKRYFYLNNLRLLARLLTYPEFHYTHNELDARAEVDGGLVLSDGGGIGITRVCVIGKNCTFIGRASITLGGMEGVDVNVDRIRIGDDCIIGHNVRIIKPLAIADGVQIKSNSVVMLPVTKAGTIVSGIPAKRKSIVPLDTIRKWNPILSILFLIENELQFNQRSDMTQKQSIADTFHLIVGDMQFRCEYEQKKFSFIRGMGFLLNHAALSQILYRIQAFFYLNHLSVIAKVIESINSFFFTVKIHCTAQIDASLLLLHANHIYIGKNVKLGKNCIFTHQNSIGSAFVIDDELSVSDQGPEIGDHVLMGAGSVICGNISIGSHSKVSINAAVDSSFPEHSVLFGVPARNMTKTAVE